MDILLSDWGQRHARNGLQMARDAAYGSCEIQVVLQAIDAFCEIRVCPCKVRPVIDIVKRPGSPILGGVQSKLTDPQMPITLFHFIHHHLLCFETLGISLICTCKTTIVS